MSEKKQKENIDALPIEEIKHQLKNEIKEELRDEISKEFHCHYSLKKKKKLIFLVSLFWLMIGLMIGMMAGHCERHHSYERNIVTHYPYSLEQGFDGPPGPDYHIVPLDGRMPNNLHQNN